MVWRCAEAVKYGKEKTNPQGQKVGCNNKAVHEWFLKENFLAVLNGVIENKDIVVQEVKEHIRQAIADSPNKGAELKEVLTGLEKIAVKKSKLIDMYTDGMIKRAEFEKSFNQYERQQEALQKRLSSLDSENKIAQDLQQKLDTIDQVVENLVRLKEFGESVCSEVLRKVVVDGRDKISFYFATDKNASVFIKMPESFMQH